MKRFLAIIFLVIILLATWWLFFRTDNVETTVVNEKSSEHIATTKHSVAFNSALENTMSNYFEMKNAFVNDDSAGAKIAASKFVISTDSIPLNELSNGDTQVVATIRQQLGDIKSNAAPISQEATMADMRKDFSMVSEFLYPFLKTLGYEGKKIYWQNCPMAFGDDKPANWLSTSTEINNPYLGMHHPEFKSSMLHCGETMDSIYAK